ncbi:MAG: hypothetical protein PSV24_00060, partial [Rhodoferax sp.]|nr:hypothetical protein [Rhodoferax sp.]
ANWLTDQLPVTGATVTIGSGFTGGSLFDLSSFSLTSLTTSSIFSLQSGSTLTLTNGGTFNAAVNVNGTLNLAGGTTSLNSSQMLASSTGAINNAATLNLSGSASIRLTNTGNGYPVFANAAGSVLNINTTSGGWSFLSDSGTQGGIVNNAGSININTGYTSWEAAFSNSSSGLLNIAAGNALSMQNGQTLQGNISLGTGSTLWVSERHGTNAWFNGTTINGAGTVQVMGGSFSPVADFTDVNAASATLLVGSNGTANILSGTTTFANLTMTGGTLDGAGTLNLNTGLTQTGGAQSGSGSTVLGSVATGTLGSATISRALTNQGTLNAATGTNTVSGPFTQSGILDVANGATFVKSGGFVNTGTIRGKGTVDVGSTGNLTNNGTIRPGASPGTLTITGNFTQGASGTLVMELGGTSQGVSYDWLNITGLANLGGTLQVDLFGVFTPATGNAFNLINAAGGIAGTFSQVNLPVGYSFSSNYGANLFHLGVLSAASSGSASAPNGLLDAFLNMGAVSYETPLLYLSGQSSPTASSSGILIQTAEIVLPDLLPDAQFASAEPTSQGSSANGLIPLFNQLTTDIIFKDFAHDSRLICR